MKQLFHLILLIIPFTLLLGGCDEEKTAVLPGFSGHSGEVMIVMEQKDWDGNPGKYISEVLEEFVPHLPQPEPQFSILHFTPEQMSNMLRQHRNLLFVTLNKGISPDSATVKLQRSKWAQGQLVFNIQASDSTGLKKLLEERGNNIVQILNETELQRLQEKFKKRDNHPVQDQVADEFGIHIQIPEGMEISKREEDFMWIKQERIRYVGNTAHDISTGIFIYEYPYINDSAFTNAQILSVRDSVLKEHVPGPAEGTYMGTEYLFPPASKAIDYKGKYAVETRGLWRMQNYFMGGPFISLSIYDPQHQRIICASGFVFGPKFNKREYIRELEAILYSVEL